MPLQRPGMQILRNSRILFEYTAISLELCAKEINWNNVAQLYNF